jgi:ATP-dependent DNA helicase PIF1
MAFPTLFSWGTADFKSRRTHTARLKQWDQYLLKWHDGRFARHPRFRYMLFDMLNRQRSSAQARYVVNNVKDLNRLSFEEIEDRLNSDTGLLNEVARAGSNLLGTRPYWARVRSDPLAQARFMTYSTAFITFSCADVQ